jgi:hypothetical protein
MKNRHKAMKAPSPTRCNVAAHLHEPGRLEDGKEEVVVGHDDPQQLAPDLRVHLVALHTPRKE